MLDLSKLYLEEIAAALAHMRAVAWIGWLVARGACMSAGVQGHPAGDVTRGPSSASRGSRVRGARIWSVPPRLPGSSVRVSPFRPRSDVPWTSVLTARDLRPRRRERGCGTGLLSCHAVRWALVATGVNSASPVITSQPIGPPRSVTYPASTCNISATPPPVAVELTHHGARPASNCWTWPAAPASRR